MRMIIDTHCHLASSKFSDMEQLISDSKELGVTHAITQGTHRKDWQPTLELVRAYPEFLSSCLGVHPTDAHALQDGDLAELAALCQEYPQAAIGEVGLDYYWPAPEGWSEESYRARQRGLLEAQFELAAQLGLNISLHSRDRSGSVCFDDVFAIARNFPKVRPVFHCFIGTMDQAESIFNTLDGYISITGVVTFKKMDALHQVLINSPLNRIMTETDAPYLSPEPYRGQLNIPGRARFVLDKIADLRGMDREQLAAITTATAKQFFRLNPKAAI